MDRSSLRRLGRRVWFWKRLPRRAGGSRILISPSSYLRYWTESLGSIHGDLISGILKVVRPGDHVWDIGANVGVAAFTAASAAGPGGSVVSIEADLALVARLRETSLRSQSPLLAPVQVFPAAICDRVGVAQFAISSHSSAANALSGFGRFDGVRETVSVPCFTLDWMLDNFRAPNVVKIDVEGAEALALRGATQLLGRVRPSLIIEVGAEAQAEVTSLLIDAEYRLFAMQDLSPIAAAVGDVTAIPLERISAVTGPTARPSSAVNAASAPGNVPTSQKMH